MTVSFQEQAKYILSKPMVRKEDYQNDKPSIQERTAFLLKQNKYTLGLILGGWYENGATFQNTTEEQMRVRILEHEYVHNTPRRR